MPQPIIICLSGWAQNPNSLNSLFPELTSSYKVINFDYTKFSSIKSCFSAIIDLNIKPDVIIGWSLGGQIAIRLLENKILTSKLLILISTPFQFVKSSPTYHTNFRIAAAMPKDSFDLFRSNFIKNQLQTLEKFSLLMMINDKKRAKELAKNLYINRSSYSNLLFWLDLLGSFQCHDLNFANFPRTIIFHGKDDLVVHYSQAKVFARKIINSELNIISNCGHCPHISNLSQLQKTIIKEINLL